MKINKNMVLGSFKEAKELKLRPIINYRLWVNGRYVQTSSGKSLWTSIGNIKNAIHNHIHSMNDYRYSSCDNKKEFISFIPIVDEGMQSIFDITIVRLKK